STARDGSTAVRLTTQPGDSYIFGSGTSERADLAISQGATGCTQGAEQWWAHSIYFPDDYVIPPSVTPGTGWNWGIVFDFHHTGSGGQANFELVTHDTGLAFWVAGGSSSAPVTYEAPIGPIVKNMWYDFVYHIRWSSGSDGYFIASVNGKPVMNYAGPTLY